MFKFLMKYDLNEQLNIVRNNEKKIQEFEENNRTIIGDPNVQLNPIDLYAPDLAVAGIHHKIYKAIGKETIIPINSFIKRNSIFENRKYFRLAYLRTVWVPNATTLPGVVVMGIMDMRAIKGKELIDHKVNFAEHMHRYTYYQDVYIHKSEMKYFNILVNLKGFEEKFRDDMHLGSIRIFWITHWTNNPTQYNTKETDNSIIPKSNMPLVRSMSLRTCGSVSSNHDYLPNDIQDEIFQLNHRKSSVDNHSGTLKLANSSEIKSKQKMIINNERVQLQDDDESKTIIIKSTEVLNKVKDKNNIKGKSIIVDDDETLILNDNEIFNDVIHGEVNRLHHTSKIDEIKNTSKIKKAEMLNFSLPTNNDETDVLIKNNDNKFLNLLSSSSNEVNTLNDKIADSTLRERNAVSILSAMNAGEITPDYIKKLIDRNKNNKRF